MHTQPFYGHCVLAGKRKRTRSRAFHCLYVHADGK